MAVLVVEAWMTPEDFARSNKKLLQMLRELEKRAPYANNAELNKMSTKKLLQCGMNTRELSDKVMGSKF